MPLDLDRLEQRIVGVLIEKQLTVPDSYPLTVNALVAGCNQKNNRDPQMTVEDYEVEGAIRSLMEKDWVREMDKAGGRAMRYEHVAGDQLGVEVADLAILAELLVRGPQGPGALKTRASRMKAFASPADVEARLRTLAARPVPYVRELPKRPREHACRWMHLLGPQPEEDAPVDAGGEVAAASPAVATPAVVAPPVAATPEADERYDALERRVAELEDRLDRLEGR